MSTKEIKTRLWMVLAIPVITAPGVIYLVAAKSAKSMHVVDVYEKIISDGLLGVIAAFGVCIYLFFKFANGRLTEITLNDTGLQACYFNSDSKWFNWEDVESVNMSSNKVYMEVRFSEKIEIPLLLFKGSDRNFIIDFINKHATKIL